MKNKLGKKEPVSKQGRKSAKPGPTLDAFDNLDADLAHGVSNAFNISTASRPEVSTTTPMTPLTTTSVFEDEDIFIVDALPLLKIDPKDKGKGVLEEEPEPVKVKSKDQAEVILSVIDWARIYCNKGGYKMKDFKGISYDDIRPIFEKVWDQVHSFMPMDSEEEVQRLKRAGQDVEAELLKDSSRANR
ncbi:hypothetical protein Tco_1391860 [Tanacetum coccineum]